MKSVYYEVENTLELPFITGIQRVTREFSKQVLAASNARALKHQYIPIVFDHSRSCWRKLTKRELHSLIGSKPRSMSFLARLVRKLNSFISVPEELYIKNFETGAIFLDIESTWHSKVKRSEILPKLRESGVQLAKIHYDIIPLLFPETSHPNTVSVFSEHFISHLQNTNLFICISQTTQRDVEDYCQQHSITPPGLTSIKLGASLRDNSRPSSEQQYGRYLLSVGTIEPRKNHLMLLEAFDAISHKTNLNLIIVGKPGWLAEDIILKIKQHWQFGKRLFHLENVSDQTLDSLYQNAWLSVIPSLYEGFGLPVVESLARHCPTICSTGGSLGEVGAGYTYLFPPTSVSELTELVLDLDSHPMRYKELRRLAVDYKPVSWSVTASEIDLALAEAY